MGFWEIESGTNCSILEFNDLGQILGRINNHIMIWDHGKKTNLTSLFLSQFPGNWGTLRASNLNNLGCVAFSVFDHNLSKCKFFIWDGNFKPICLNKEISELNDEDNFVRFLDDENNMILDLHLSRTEKRYFINPHRNFFIPCAGCESIRNGLPISINCLPSKFKKDRQGNFYFQKGIEIRRLIQEKPPYYISNIRIGDQNSKGYVVGSVDTLYGSHAFLAIPELDKD